MEPTPKTDGADITTAADLDSRSQLSEVEQTRRGLDKPWELPDYDPDPVQDGLYGDYNRNAPANGAGDSEESPLAVHSPGDAHRSFSVGYPNNGGLVGGRLLAHRGKHHRVLPMTIKRGYFWGTDQLVDLVLYAANRVAKQHPDTQLSVGNLSSARGGRITTSVSHQSGRDADLGLFCTDLDEQLESPNGFPVFDGSRGDRVDRSGQYLIDIPRNWALIEALLSAPGSRLQWIFLDNAIKRMLLDYAIRNQRNSDVIHKAEKIIMRPKDSSAHNDHIHIRVFCSKRDLNGISSDLRCHEYGPDWKWEQVGRQTDEKKVHSQVDAIMGGDKSILEIPTDDADTEAAIPLIPPEPSPKPKSDPADPPTDIEIRI